MSSQRCESRLEHFQRVSSQRRELRLEHFQRVSSQGHGPQDGWGGQGMDGSWWARTEGGRVYRDLA